MYGCGFHYLGILYIDNDINWLNENDLINAPFFDQYINTFYFSIISMVTVGYGDITPKST